MNQKASAFNWTNSVSVARTSEMRDPGGNRLSMELSRDWVATRFWQRPALRKWPSGILSTYPASERSKHWAACQFLCVQSVTGM